MDLKEGFFQSHNFLVTPYAHHKTVFVPDINYTHLANLNIKRGYLYNNESKKYEEAFTETYSQLKSYEYPKTVNSEIIKDEFINIKKEFERDLKYIFPDQFSKIAEINIILTPFGTRGSFDYRHRKDKIAAWIWLSNTQVNKTHTLSEFIHCYISLLVLLEDKTPDVKTYHWKAREGIIDFITTHTRLKKYFSLQNQTLHSLNQQDITASLITDSYKYLQKLNMGIKPPTIKKRDDTFYINNQPVHKLTAKEHGFMTLLFNDLNTYITKDVVCEKLYSDPDDCSDWAITKLVQRVRSKITRSGIIYPVIQTSRKMGYKLICAV